MRNRKNWLVALLVAIAIFLGLSAIASPAMAAGPVTAKPYNLAVNFMYDQGKISQWLSFYDAKTKTWRNIPAKRHSHIVRKGNIFWLKLKKGERVIKGNGDMYYARYRHGVVTSNIFERYNGARSQLVVNVKIGPAKPKRYTLIEGTVELAIKGLPLTTNSAGKG